MATVGLDIVLLAVVLPMSLAHTGAALAANAYVLAKDKAGLSELSAL